MVASDEELRMDGMMGPSLVTSGSRLQILNNVLLHSALQPDQVNKIYFGVY